MAAARARRLPAMTSPAPLLPAAAAAPPGVRVLLVDDEPDISALVAYHLAKAGYRVATAATGAEAVEAAASQRPALVVLDLMLPDLSGFEVLERLRAAEGTREVAVLMLTARRDEADRIRGLALGADDYLTKPFSPPERVLRGGAILRRVHAAPVTSRGGARDAGRDVPDVLEVGALRIDRAAYRVAVNGVEVELTPTEYKLLVLLAERRGRLQDRGQLLQRVWDAAPDLQTRTVDMHVQRLRAKLGPAGELIETVRGFGYRLRGERARVG